MPLFSPTRRMLSRPTSVFVQPQKNHADTAVTVQPADSVASADQDESSSLSSMSGSQDDCCSRPHTPSSSQPDLVHSPTCLYSKRPTLNEILADKASPPWTLSAFTAYCSQNLCLENLEFTIDASRYERAYTRTMADPSRQALPSERQELILRWRRLLQIYIAESGPREINIPGNVRDEILNVSDEPLPPSPRHLQPAVRKIRELLEDSILLPFLNEVRSYESPDEYSAPYAIDMHPPRANTVSVPGRGRENQFGHFPRKHASAPGHHFTQRPTALLPALNGYSSGGGSSSGFSDMPFTSEASEISPSRTHGPSTPPHSPPAVTFAPSPRSRSDAGGGGWKKMGEKLGLRKSSHSKLKGSKSNSSAHSPI